MRQIIILFLTLLVSCPYALKAQEVAKIAMSDTLTAVADTAKAILTQETAHSTPDSTVMAVMRGADSAAAVAAKDAQKKKKEFKPNPTKATLLALVPGLGQIYNKKYWKLPIVYGGFMGCLYAVTWNNRQYQDYSLAYKDIIQDYNNGKPSSDPASWHQSWQDLLNGRDAKDYIGNTSFHNQLKSRKDYFRRYRDLSIIITAGIYLLSIADAYIDAQLFDFDISPDISLHLEPTVTPRTSYTPSSYGLNCSLTF